MQDDCPRDGEIIEDAFYMSGIRTQRAFLLLEGELDALVWAPWWVRRRIVKHVKAQTKFDDRDSDGSGEASETGTGSTVGDSAGPKDIAQGDQP